MMNVNDFEKKQLIFVFLNQGERVSFSNDNIVIRDDEKKIKHQSTCYRIFALMIVGHITITTGIIQRSHKFGFPIFLMTPSMRVYDVIGRQMKGNVLLRKLQYAYASDELARHIILNKIKNQRLILNRQRKKSDGTKAAINSLDQYLEHLSIYDGGLLGMLGIEGSASRIYFKNHFNNIEWQGRKPRIKCDYVNSTLDIGYTILFNLVEALLNNYGFDEYCGVLHKQFYMRKSLVCDLVEPFRPIIDFQIKKAVNLHQCKEEDFDIVNGRWLLKWSKNAQYTDFITQPLLQQKRDLFIYIQSYYRAFMKQKPAQEFPIFNIEDDENDNIML